MENQEFASKVGNLNNQEERAAFLQQEGFDLTKDELIEVASGMNAVDVVGAECCGHTHENYKKCEANFGFF